MTINLENAQTNTLNTSAIVGLAIFAQSWYWFPLAHFLSLSFAPTSVIGVRGSDLKIPKFELNCHANQEYFQYPPKVEESKEKQPDKLATAVLSTTAKAKTRAKKKQHKKEEDDKMDVDVDTKEDKKVEKKTEDSAETKDNKASKDESKKDDAKEVSSLPATIRYTKTSYKIENLSRVLPQQSGYVSFIKDDRFVPVRKFRGTGSIIVLQDTKPDEPIEFIKTVRQLNITTAPMPEPFTLSGEDLEE